MTLPSVPVKEILILQIWAHFKNEFECVFENTVQHDFFHSNVIIILGQF